MIEQRYDCEEFESLGAMQRFMHGRMADGWWVKAHHFQVVSDGQTFFCYVSVVFEREYERKRPLHEGL